MYISPTHQPHFTPQKGAGFIVPLFLTSKLDRDKRSASRFGHFNPSVTSTAPIGQKAVLTNKG
jgi:hypothetical protein